MQEGVGIPPEVAIVMQGDSHLSSFVWVFTSSTSLRLATAMMSARVVDPCFRVAPVLPFLCFDGIRGLDQVK
jgi:hypothetical protein